MPVGVKFMNSASVEDSATIVWRFVFQRTGAPAANMMWPPVEWRVSSRSANDASAYAWRPRFCGVMPFLLT